MGGKLLRIVGEPQDERAGGGGVDPCGGDGFGVGADGGSRWREAAVLETAAAPGRGSERRRRTALVIEAAEPVLAIDAAEVGVADRRRMGDKALLEAGPGLDRKSTRLNSSH